MKSLIDESLSPQIAAGLIAAGHEAHHARDGLLSTQDEVVFEKAAEEECILVSADTDFAEILALRNESRPSLILLKLPNWRPKRQLEMILAVLPAVRLNLEDGAVVVLERDRTRIRPLPMDEG